MGNFVEMQDLGLSVFGQSQVSYIVDGKADQTYAEAVSKSTLRRALSVEEGLAAYEQLLRKRQTKLDDLGKALAYIAETVASFEKDDKTTTERQVNGEVATICARYGITVENVTIDTNMSRGDCQKVQQAIRFALDMENNNCQQDLTTMQGYLNKRDDAFNLASKLAKRAMGTISNEIRYIG